MGSAAHYSDSPDNSRWHVLIAAWLGLMFDGMDATILVLVLYPALSELLHTTSHAVVGVYGGIVMAVFMVGWAIGSIVFGVLSDHIGRTRTMVFTVLLYAACTGLCACSHSWIMLALFRFLVGCGIGGEQSTGIVLIAESWKGKARLHATGVMTSSFGCGYLAASFLNLWLGHLGWRWLFVAGIIPALLTLYIRAKLKDPLQFQLVQEYKRRLRATAVSSVQLMDGPIAKFKQLFATQNRSNLIMVSTLASTAIVGLWAVMSWIPPWINQLTGTLAVSERTSAAIAMNIGGIVASLLAGTIVIGSGQRNALRFAFAGALISITGMFLTVKLFGSTLLIWMFAAGFFTQLPFSFVFMYAPELFDARIRGTAIGFSIQIGRFMGAAGALLGGQLIALFAGSYAMAGSCVALFYLVGITATFFMRHENREVELSPELIFQTKEESVTVVR